MNKNLQKYEAFVAAARSGSFTAAAEKLNYTQSAVSRMVLSLEDEWGVKLFKRDKFGVKLTADGEALCFRCEKLIGEFKNLELCLNEIKGVERGVIRIGVFSSVATHVLPTVIKKFKQDYPLIDYELLMGDYEEIERWIRDGRVDCGFTLSEYAGGLKVLFEKRDELKAIVPLESVFDGDRFDIKDFESRPFIMLEKGGHSEIESLLEKYGVHADIQFKTWDDYAVMSMVENGLGLSVLPNLILKKANYRIAAKSFVKKEYRNIAFAVKNLSDLSLAAKKFVGYVKF